jgi:hypothetical protein
LFQQANGKGQESSSEAINAYYSCFLYGLSTSNFLLSQFSHTLLAMEIEGAIMYWHMDSYSSKIYDKIFSQNGMVGNIGSFDVSSSTWFGNEPEFVHGINIMPLTPVSSLLLPLNFSTQQFALLKARLLPPISIKDQQCESNRMCYELGLIGLCCPTSEGVVLSCCNVVSNSTLMRMQDEWKSFILITEAIINKDNAWNEVIKMNGFGLGNSKSNTLLFIATRTENNIKINDISQNKSNLISRKCIENSPCVALGFSSSNCCPTNQNITLNCCPIF